MIQYIKDYDVKAVQTGFRFICLALLGAGLVMPAGAATGVALAWNASADVGVAGYAIYYGTNSGDHSARFDVGTNLMASFSDLSVGSTYYFVVKAYNAAALESQASDEVSFAPTNTAAGNRLQVSLSSAVVSMGQSGSVTISAASGPSVTNLIFTLDAPAGWTGSLTVQSLLPPNVLVTQNPPGALHSQITVQTMDGQPLPQQPLIEVDFTAQNSATTFSTSLQVSGITALPDNGRASTNTPVAFASPITVVGADSYLRMQLVNGQANLILYGPVGNSYQVQSTATPSVAASWNNEFATTMTNLSQTFATLPVSGAPMKFFRTVRL